MNIAPTRRPAVAYFVLGSLLVHPFENEADRNAHVEQLKTMADVSSLETCTLQKPGWRHPNAMALNTGNTAFETRQVCIMTGNCISDTQLGQYVRPRNETRCNGRDWPPAKLQKFDLGAFKSIPEASAMVRYIDADPRFENEQCIAYVIFHRGTTGRRVVHGALVTDTRRKLIAQFTRPELGLPESAKSQPVLQAARFYLTDECLLDRRPVATAH